MKVKVSVAAMFGFALVNAGLALCVPRISVEVENEALCAIRGGDNKVCAICDAQACDSVCSGCNTVSPVTDPTETYWQYVNTAGVKNDGYKTAPTYTTQVNRTLTSCPGVNIVYYDNSGCSGTATGADTVMLGTYSYLMCTSTGWLGSCAGIPIESVCPY